MTTLLVAGTATLGALALAWWWMEAEVRRANKKYLSKH